MTNVSYRNIDKYPDRKVRFLRRLSVFRKLKTDRKFMMILLAVCMIETVLFIFGYKYISLQDWHWLGYSIITVSKNAAAVVYAVFLLLSFELMSTPSGSQKQEEGFYRIGLYNSARQVPALIYKNKKDGVTTFEYYCNGIPLSKFQEDKDKIEAVLNISIVNIKQGRSKSRIIVTSKSGKYVLPDFAEWDDAYLQKTDNMIVLGKDLNGLRIVKLDVTPHIQCGGSTGSGKTVLFRSVLYQLAKQQAKIYLVDFKGGVDFSKGVRERYQYITTKEEMLDVLNSLINEMERRKKLFADAECSNITEYNFNYPEKAVKRIMFASDEIAYAFQKKGLRGEEKDLVEFIESKMALLAQQSRFAGIHLWLSTQRGDAETIPPQIRSNMGVRICGRASDILSRVTIDNPLASEIPSDIRGRFVDDERNFFQAFYFNSDSSERM